MKDVSVALVSVLCLVGFIMLGISMSIYISKPKYGKYGVISSIKTGPEKGCVYTVIIYSDTGLNYRTVEFLEKCNEYNLQDTVKWRRVRKK